MATRADRPAAASTGQRKEEQQMLALLTAPLEQQPRDGHLTSPRLLRARTGSACHARTDRCPETGSRAWAERHARSGGDASKRSPYRDAGNACADASSCTMLLTDEVGCAQQMDQLLSADSLRGAVRWMGAARSCAAAQSCWAQRSGGEDSMRRVMITGAKGHSYACRLPLRKSARGCTNEGAW